MKKFFLIFLVIGLASCNQQDSTATIEATDGIKSSQAYQDYVVAFNEYQACKEERPGITNAYMNKELTAPEFEKALEKNAKMCALKKQIFNTRWQMLQTEYDKLSEEYQIKTD